MGQECILYQTFKAGGWAEVSRSGRGRWLGGHLEQTGEIHNKGCLLTPAKEATPLSSRTIKEKVLGQPEANSTVCGYSKIIKLILNSPSYTLRLF